jgi:PadR family transcriptional regulator PadR
MNLSVNSDIIRGHIDTIVLNLLKDNDKYGYEISKIISSKTNGEYDLKEATLYSSLKRLETEGAVKSYWGDETQGGRRKYYQITNFGKKMLEENKQNWFFAKKILDLLIF